MSSTDTHSELGKPIDSGASLETPPRQPGATLASVKVRPEHLERLAVVYIRQSSPRQVVENRESRARQYALTDYAALLGWPSERILVIDDDPDVATILITYLESEWHTVRYAKDGEEGAHKARTAEYDVIILDIMLPKEDGLSLLKKWRRAGLKSHVLLLTARGMDGLRSGPDQRNR